MINIHDKRSCCGCWACMQRCPQQCISMEPDEQGFLYPKVDHSNCINCGVCEKVCPVLHPNKEQKPLKLLAGRNQDIEVVMQSSSGGLFSALATETLSNKGVVFSAIYNKNWQVEHARADSNHQLPSMRGSKYAQSNIGKAYKEAEIDLKHGKKVLFVGTPCQIAGLKHFLHKDYEQLLTIEVFCHGVPSPLVWGKWLEYISKGKGINDICQRDKRTGWTSYSVRYRLENKEICHYAWSDDYMRGFIYDYMRRPACYLCPSKGGRSGADIALGDLWGINKTNILNDEKGITLAVINSEKGLTAIKKYCQYELNVASISDYNNGYRNSVEQSQLSTFFWKKFLDEGIKALRQTNDHHGPSRLILRWLLLKIKLSKYIVR